MNNNELIEKNLNEYGIHHIGKFTGAGCYCVKYEHYDTPQFKDGLLDLFLLTGDTLSCGSHYHYGWFVLNYIPKT